MIESVLNDIRYALRSLRKTPGFTVVAVASIALGIGVNTTIFSLVNAVLLRPLPVTNPDTLVDVYTSSEEGIAQSSTSYPDYKDLRAHNAVFSETIGHSMMFAPVNRQGRSQLVVGEVVTGNYFTVLGVHAAAGRLFLPEDDQIEGARPVVVLGHGFWTREFGSDRSLVGRTLKIRGVDHTIVGIAPPSFNGLLPGLVPDIWVPAMMVAEVEPAGMQDVVASPDGSTRLERRGTRWMFVKGRLKPGVTLQQAQANVDVIMASLASAYPETNKGRKALLMPSASVRIHPLIDQALTPGASLLMVVVGLVLVIACANVANMLLTRATGRKREIGVRLAIGASRARLVRQLLTESLVLSALGASAGLLLASWTTRLLLALQPPLPFTVRLDLGFDARVFLFALLIAVVTGVAFGLAPALQASRPNLVASLKEDGAPIGRLRRVGLRDLLVVGQVTVSIVLLIAATLFVRSLAAAQAADVGFDARRLAFASIDLDMLRYSRARGEAFYRDMLQRVRAMPGVESAALAERLPLGLNVTVNTIGIPGQQNTPANPGFSIDTTSIGTGYFSTLGVPILEGRDFTEADAGDSPRVAIVTQAMARRFWPGESAVGKRVERIGSSTGWCEIIGVAADHKVRTVGEAPRPFIHFARAQRYSPYTTVLVRTRGDADAMAAALRRELLAAEPELVFIENQSMEASLAATLFPARIGAILLGTFGLLALALASIGLYGVVAYSVSRRTREIGIRMALGADRATVVREVLGQGLARVFAGVLLGLGAAFAATRLLAGALYGVGAADPASYAIASILLIAVAMVANLVPARRAAAVDPMVALRQ